MELRVLHYFLAVAREQSISAAAKSLHLSQPTLSTQLRALEEELGKQLFVRGSKGSRKITLTEEGMLLRKRADEILELVRKTENEIVLADDAIAGEVYISAPARPASCGSLPAPPAHCRKSARTSTVISPAAMPIMSWNSWEKGLIDFGLLYAAVDPLRYNSIPIPLHDEWGVLMRRDDRRWRIMRPLPQQICSISRSSFLSKKMRSSTSVSGWAVILRSCVSSPPIT